MPTPQQPLFDFRYDPCIRSSKSVFAACCCMAVQASAAAGCAADCTLRLCPQPSGFQLSTRYNLQGFSPSPCRANWERCPSTLQGEPVFRTTWAAVETPPNTHGMQFLRFKGTLGISTSRLASSSSVRRRVEIIVPNPSDITCQPATSPPQRAQTPSCCHLLALYHTQKQSFN
jgi:hypothetical protein